MFTKSIGAPTIQTVNWDDVGGLIHVKEEIMSALKPSKHNIKRRSGNIIINRIIHLIIVCLILFNCRFVQFFIFRNIIFTIMYFTFLQNIFKSKLCIYIYICCIFIITIIFKLEIKSNINC